MSAIVTASTSGGTTTIKTDKGGVDVINEANAVLLKYWGNVDERLVPPIIAHLDKCVTVRRKLVFVDLLKVSLYTSEFREQLADYVKSRADRFPIAHFLWKSRFLKMGATLFSLGSRHEARMFGPNEEQQFYVAYERAKSGTRLVGHEE